MIRLYLLVIPQILDIRDSLWPLSLFFFSFENHKQVF